MAIDAGAASPIRGDNSPWDSQNSIFSVADTGVYLIPARGCCVGEEGISRQLSGTLSVNFPLPTIGQQRGVDTRANSGCNSNIVVCGVARVHRVVDIVNP
jgi:hypothetical protein